MSTSDNNRKLLGRGDGTGFGGDRVPTQKASGAVNSVHEDDDDSNEGNSCVSKGVRDTSLPVAGVEERVCFDRVDDKDDMAAGEFALTHCDDDQKSPERGNSAGGNGNDEPSQEHVDLSASTHIDSNEDQSHASYKTDVNDFDERGCSNGDGGGNNLAAGEGSTYDAPVAGPNTGGATSCTSESRIDALDKSSLSRLACVSEVDSGMDGDHGRNKSSSSEIVPPASTSAGRVARKMGQAKERVKFNKVRQAEAKDTTDVDEDPGEEDIVRRVDPGDDIAAAYFAARQTSPKDESGGGTIPLATNDAPKIYQDSDDCTTEPPPVETFAVAPPVTTSQGSFIDEETTPGAYAARGQAPFLPHNAVRRRGLMQIVRQSLTSSTSQASATANETSSMVPTAEAVAVDEVEFKDNIRKQILADAARAEVVKSERAYICGATWCREHCRQRKKYVLMAPLVVVLGAVLGLSIGLTRDGSNSGTDDTRSVSVLDTVIQRGMVICDNSMLAENRFDQDLCRAIAAAVFGNPDRVSYEEVSSAADGFIKLSTGKVDVLTSGYTHTFERDIYEEFTKVGFSFSVPYLYSGLSVGGIPSYVSCVDSKEKAENCAGFPVCVLSNTKWSDLIPADDVIEVDNLKEAYKELNDGTCYVIVGEKTLTSEAIARRNEYDGPYEVRSISLSIEPLSLVTPRGDQLWSDLVNWVIQALFTAEEQNITQATASLFPEVNFSFTGLNSTMFRNVIAAVGNYGELYDRRLQAILPRESINEINIGDSGLIYSPPLGVLRDDGPGPSKGGTLERIEKREKLVCGVVAERDDNRTDSVEGCENWHQCLDADFCHAVAASATHSIRDSSVEIIFIRDAHGGFEKLAEGEIDILAGAHISIEKDIHDPKLGVGFSFSQPYFYETREEQSPIRTRAVATRQDDPQWSDFVYWVVASTFYAEMKKISGEGPKKKKMMPLVYLFGKEYRRMFRDAILAVGNYGEIYARNVTATIPRGGRNLNNAISFGPQHFPIPFF
uniref:Solute-binding protein family 3/N-terminal domain-containing protein n=1 Tax=Odontella aurita TaxID=265563 RepID=A0A7S4J4M7_9STRA|mmetsp:Transcript_38424/g.115159  ORF Transcript_38424/g.115159 Transcript_38424/m.115159 type:complete len:1009 (+) Transcript_38424:81-3107(+)